MCFFSVRLPSSVREGHLYPLEVITFEIEENKRSGYAKTKRLRFPLCLSDPHDHDLVL